MSQISCQLKAILVGCFLILLSSFLIITWPLPYDESLYRSFSEALAYLGRPFIHEYPGGYFLVFHPYLVFAFQALFIKIGVNSIISLRFIHLLFWVLPILYITWKMSRDIFNSDRVGVWSLIFLATIGFFFTESATAELDMPYTLFFLVSTWLTWRWHSLIRTGQSPFSKTWLLLTLVLSVGMWVKFQCGIQALSMGLLTLIFVFQVRESRGKILSALGITAALCTITLFGWILTAHLMGADLPGTFSYLSSGLKGENPAYQFATSQYSWLRYSLFLATFINIGLVVVSGLGLLYTIRTNGKIDWIYLAVPLALVLLTLLASGIRVVRYMDPALPILAIFAASWIQHEKEDPLDHLEFYFALFISILILVFFKMNISGLPIRILSFQADFFLVSALMVSTISFALLHIFNIWNRNTLWGLLIGGLFSLSLPHFNDVSLNSWEEQKGTSALSSKILQECAKNPDTVFELSHISLSFALRCNFVMKENEEFKLDKKPFCRANHLTSTEESLLCFRDGKS